MVSLSKAPSPRVPTTSKSAFLLEAKSKRDLTTEVDCRICADAFTPPDRARFRIRSFHFSCHFLLAVEKYRGPNIIYGGSAITLTTINCDPVFFAILIASFPARNEFFEPSVATTIFLIWPVFTILLSEE